MNLLELCLHALCIVERHIISLFRLFPLGACVAILGFLQSFLIPSFNSWQWTRLNIYHTPIQLPQLNKDITQIALYTVASTSMFREHNCQSK
jgi:hypothetical protein